jgi:hypothetical protein
MMDNVQKHNIFTVLEGCSNEYLLTSFVMPKVLASFKVLPKIFYSKNSNMLSEFVKNEVLVQKYSSSICHQSLK